MTPVNQNVLNALRQDQQGVTPALGYQAASIQYAELQWGSWTLKWVADVQQVDGVQGV